MTPRAWPGVLGLVALSWVGAASGALLTSTPLATPAHRHKLTRALDEVSGLATTADGRLLAHEDQRAIVYELDPLSGDVAKRFALGRKLRGDFEGIAEVDGTVYLVTSTGKLVRGPEGADGEEVDYEVFETNVRERCHEIEGLAYEPNERLLLLACKRARGGTQDVLIFRWSLEREQLTEPVWRALPQSALALPGARGPFRPSGIARDPRSGHWLLLSAAPPALAELSADGELLQVRALDGTRHRQPEGITLAPDALWIADEGAGKRARLAAYGLGKDQDKDKDKP
ncbi:MAG: SdiA-regulated domain-containing protein [Myxococcota bacterium]